MRSRKSRAPGPAAILLGEPIADRKILAANDGNLMSSLVREGFRRLPSGSPTARPAVASSCPNDRVDIIATFRWRSRFTMETRKGDRVQPHDHHQCPRACDQPVTRAGADTQPDRIETAVLELDPQQAEIIARSEAQGELSLALRSSAMPGDGSSADDIPALASLTEVPNSVEIFKQGFRLHLQLRTALRSCAADGQRTLPACRSRRRLDNSASNPLRP